jgi:hypothetical protein
MTQRRTRQTRKRDSATTPTSGAIGGPATGRGIKYQVDYAVLQSLDLISKALSMPHIPFAIWMEPRNVEGGTTVAWDLGTEPPAEVCEVKLSPVRHEILAWLGRVAQQAQGDATARFQLVYDRGGGQALLTLQQLIRNAIESSGDEGRFGRQIQSEGVSSADELLVALQPGALAALARTEVVHMPENVLALDLQFFARQLAGETGGRRLVELLFRRFSAALANRQRFLVQALIDEISAAGIELHAHPDISCENLDTRVREALVILQACPAGLPLQVLAQAISIPEELLTSALGLVLGSIVFVEDGLASVRRLRASFTCSDRDRLLGRALEAILAFIDGHKQEASGKIQVRNAIALAEVCAFRSPQVTAIVFRELDKLLKDIGDKHLVLQIAELSVRAARASQPRMPEVTKGEAHALICGRSWVYQRINRLTDARAAAEESLRLGEDIHWGRNTAYCKKCIGRLLRLEAEREVDAQKKKQLLADSAAHLNEAIERFSSLSEFGPNDPEVGDCYSLLGRTLLVEGRLAEADQAVRNAGELIPDMQSKDFLDLLLLDGDLQRTQGDRKAADDCYSQALELNTHPNLEVSEMRARAYFKRGVNLVDLRQKTLATQAFRKAAELWRGLGEAEFAAEAEWNEILLTNDLSVKVKVLLQKESPWIRVRVFRIHEERVAVGRKAKWARREEPGTAYWEHLISEARQRFRIEVATW